VEVTMDKIALTFLLIISTAIFVPNSVFAESKIKIMPEDIVQIASINKCQQIDDFYERPGMVNPPYAYGFYEGEVGDSFVFWCEVKKKEATQYYLVIYSDQAKKQAKKESHKECPNKIAWSNYPGGLSIYSGSNTIMDGFVYVNNPRKKAPQNIILTHNAIRSYYDGLEELFYCYNGEWLVRQLD
jgi:hypothetical protein